MFLRKRWTILEKIFICSLITLHLSLILPLSEVFPLPKTIKNITKPEVFAEEPTEPTNHPSVLDPIGNKVINEGEQLEFTVSANDPDGDALVYSASNLPTGAVFDPTTQVFNWTPSYQQAGTYENVYFETAEVIGWQSENDEDTKLALHCTGINGSKVLIDSSPSNHAVTTYGDAKIDTSTKVFGTGSLKLDGSGDYLTVPDHTDWNFGDGDFTTDFWIRFNALPATNTPSDIVSIFDSSSSWWSARLWNLSGKYYWWFQYWNGVSYPVQVGSSARTISTNTWYHVAFVRSGNTMYVFENGTQVGTSSVTGGSIPDMTSAISIGKLGPYTSYLNGHMDEIRITHNNYFGVSPNSSLTNKISIPVRKYLEDTQAGSSGLSGGIDEDTKLALHCTGINGSKVLVDSSPSNHAVTTYGDAKIDTSTKVFGTGSLKLDGNGDYLAVPDHTDWNFGDGDFTIDFWVRFNSLPTSGNVVKLYCQFQDVNNYFTWYYYNVSGTYSFQTVSQSTAVGIEFAPIFTPSPGLATNTWYHFALTRSGTSFRMFQDGTQVGDTATSSGAVVDNTGLAVIGADVHSGQYLDGWIDEFRISKGIARWTIDFAKPTSEYSEDIGYYLTGDTVSEDITITVNNINAPPTVSISPAYSCVNVNTDVTLHISAQDEDGDALTYVLKENGTVVNYTSDYKVTKTDTGIYKYEVIATDSHSETATATCIVEVIDSGEKAGDALPISGDFNGDGLTDIGTFTKTTGDWKVAISNNGVFDNVQLWMSSFKGESIERTYSVTGDFNGDGRTDIAFYDAGGKNSAGKYIPGGTWKFAFSDGEKFTYDEKWDVSKFGGGDCKPLIGDFNGDGLTDIGYSSPSSSSGNFCIKLAKKDKKGFEDTAISYQANLEKPEIYSGDFNGDGLADILSFKKATGEWKVLLAQDATSSQLVDWVQNLNPNTDIIQTGGNDASKIKLYDGDFGTNYWAYSYAPRGAAFAILTSTFTFSNPVYLTKVIFKQGGSYGGALTGRKEGYVKLYYNAGGEEVISKSIDGTYSVNGNWTDVKKIEMYMYSYGDGGSKEGDARADQYELQAWGPDDEIETNEGLPAFAEGANWKTNFGQGKEPIITDYNHDGKTDIGYFDGGKWHYALSSGTNFEKNIDPDWPSLAVGSDDLPSGGDYNGDGIGDAAVFHQDKYGVLNKWEIQLHNSKQPDLLIAVNNGIDGTTNIEYDVSTQFDNTGNADTDNTPDLPDLPFPLAVVKKVTKTDGIGHNYAINYHYEGGKFEPDSREFRGFEYVKVTDSESTVSETKFHQDAIRKGRPDEEIISDANEKTYSKVKYEWGSEPRHSGLVTFPYLVSTTSTLYNHTDGKSRDIKTVYSVPDDYGNVERVDELGFVANSDFADDSTDDRCTVIEYEYNTDLSKLYIFNKPKHTTIKKGESTVSETCYSYDHLGSLKEEKRWLDKGSSPVTKFKYDYEINPNISCGNLVEVEDALGRKTSTAYDVAYGYTFPVSITNILGHTQSFTYDPATGQILTSTDPNGQITKTKYDGFGRIEEIRGPNDDPIDETGLPGIEYFYDLNSRPVKITTVTKIDEGVTTTSYAFIDGLGRTIEVKTEAEKPGEQLLSGIVKYDERGQIKEKYLPYIVPSSGNYVAPNYAQLKISYEYDPIGRVIRTIGPDNVSSCIQYDGWIVTAIDGNSHKLQSEKDAFGRLIKVTEYNGAETYITQYKYDALGNLEKTIDAQRNETTIKYDTLGRKISMDDPDMGEWSYEYDAVGNLVSQTDYKGQVISFQYDAINRLFEKSGLSPEGTVPDFSVTYAYDTVTPDNPYAKGRLTKVTDPSGTTEFFYDNLGREIKTVKGLSPQGTVPPEYYTVERTYDSIDRLKTITYPDGEVITYEYNKAGGIETIKGLSPQGTVPYVTNVDYNEYGQMTRIDYGNDTYTTYKYDDYNFRLENLQTKKGQADIQNLSYTFDNVGNVLSIKDGVSPPNSQSFGYDDLSRLTSATSSLGGYGNITYAYNSIGNMTSRTSLRGADGDEAISYAYGEGDTRRPHAVTSYTLSDNRYTLAYDANGNMTRKEYEGGVKTFKYDIENRLVEVGVPKEDISTHTININLSKGWNFVSIPLVTTDSIWTILSKSGISKAQLFRYNPEKPEGEKWEKYAFDSSYEEDYYKQFRDDDFDNFEYGRGYEIYVESECTLKASGVTPLTPKILELYPGWNLIAAPTAKDPIPVKEALSGITYEEVVAASSLRGIEDAEAISYNPVTALETGNSYYVKVLNQRTWNIPREQDKTTFVYDGDGGRVKKITSDETVTYIGSSYEVTTGTVPEGGLSRIKKHIFMGSTRICTVEGTVPEGGLSPETWDYHYFHSDHIGSSNVITDGSGKIARVYEYDPYGLTTGEPREYTYSTDHLFTGKLFDTDTGLYYYGARYYDPELGRFIQPDTIVPYPDDPQSFNRYAYARNNPIRYVDPTGHSFLAFLGAILAFISAVAATVATVAGVGAMVAGAMGYHDLARTLGNIAMVAGIVAVASSAGAQICNILATPAPPNIYSDITKLDSNTLSEVTGYDELPMALQDQPLLEAGGSSVYEGKAVAKNAQAFTETLGLSSESAKVAGAQVTTVNIGHTATLGEAQTGGFTVKSIMKFGTYTGEGTNQISIMDFTTGEYENLYKQFVLFGENFYMGSTSSGGLSFSFAGNSMTIGGGSIVSFSRGIEVAGFYSSIETSISSNIKSIYNTFDSIRASLNTKPSYSPYLKGVPIFRPPQPVIP